jgi:cell division protein ZipA
MDQLRLILLIFGVALIAGIFVWELFKKRAAERRRAQIVEHLSEQERGLLTGESVLGDIGKADPFDVVQRVQERRSRDHEAAFPDTHGAAEAQEAHLDDYDIDEDFPGEPDEEITRTPAPADMTASPAHAHGAPEGGGADPLIGLAARRDGPEQLDLTGLDLAVPARGAKAPARAERRGQVGDARRENDPSDPDPESVEELHIVMTVMAREGEKFSGNALRHALESADLYHGEMNIFHRHEQPEDHRSPTLFSAANVLAPGYFEPARMDTLSSPGIAMFMRLPGPEKPVDAFQQMLDAARTVAQDLNGTLCDETRSTLTPQSINHLRERIADFGRRQMLKA